MDTTRRSFVKQLGAGAAALAGWGPDAGAGPGRKPNFLFILMDDMGWADTGYSGNAFHETPNIDSLAGQGVVFTDGYAPAPFCAPSRTSVMTGQWPARVYWKGVADLEQADRTYRCAPWHQVCTEKQAWDPPDLRLLPEALGEAGYATGHVGKWHVSTWRERGPEDQGFETAWGGGPMCGQPGSHFPPYDIPDAGPGKHGQHLTKRVTDEAIRFLRDNKDRPFYLQVWHYAVHLPIDVETEHVAAYRLKARAEDSERNPAYAAMVQGADDSVGRLLRALDELGLRDNTLVIFTSDNGGLAWSGCERITVNEPLRGQKGTLWEGGIRAPFVVRWPGVTKPGAVCRTPVTSMDLYPTLIELAGGRCADGQPVDGADLAPLLRGEDALGDRPLFWYDPVYRVLKEEISTPTAAVRLGEYKLMKSYHDGLSLYNLHEDMGETNNLAGAMPEKAAELERLVDAWMAETGVCPPYPNAAYDASARIPRQVEDFSPEGAELVRTWDFSERENFWRAARHCEVAAAGQAMRVKFTGFYPEVVTNIDARPGVYVAVLRYRYPANGRFRMHWAEKGPGRNGTVELYPEDDGEWHEVAALFEARRDVAELRIAAGVNRLRYGWHDPSRDREYAELRRIRLYRL